MTQLFKCPGCGGPVSPAAQACPRCGQQITAQSTTSIPPVQPVVVAPTVPMPQLEQPAPAPQAGRSSETALPSSTATPAIDQVAGMAQTPPPRKRRRIGLIIGLSVGIPVGVVMFLIIGGALLGAFMFQAAEDEMYALAEAEQQITVIMDLALIEAGTEAYRIQYPGACPALSDLIIAGHLQPNSRIADPWGWPYVLNCAGLTVDAYSVGPDGIAGTIDDINN